MQWELLGFKDDPFRREPISEYSLQLYTGNKNQIDSMLFAMHSNNVLMVIDGERGVGTTSFANFIRFNRAKEKAYFTPTSEIKVEPVWNADTLIAAVVGNVVKTLEVKHFDMVHEEKAFIRAKAVVSQITEKYKSFGFSGLGFGASYGESGLNSQPMLMPTPMIADYLEDLAKLVIDKLGYKHGVLIQLNNLDVGTVQDEAHLKMLLNVMRDYFQMPGTSWMLVGDQHLRRFIAQKIDRVDDIISTKVTIAALSMAEYFELIKKRVNYFGVNDSVQMPVDDAVWEYLFKVTSGRLRYIFGLMNRLSDTVKLGVLTDNITLDLAKPILKKLSEERIMRNKLSAIERKILECIVNHDGIQNSAIAELLQKSRPQISQNLTALSQYGLVEFHQDGRVKAYSACIDAKLAYQVSSTPATSDKSPLNDQP